MSLVNWSELPVRTKRSRKRLYSVLAEEFGLESWIGLDINVKRSKIHLYSYIASELGLVGFDELPVECRRSTRLMYNFIKENASGGGSSSDTLTVTVSDGTDIITGASVTIEDNTIVTGDDGTASFELEYGDYTCTVTCTGYESATESLSFRSNHKNFSITLTESGGGSDGVTIKLSQGGFSDTATSWITPNLEGETYYDGVLTDGAFTFENVPDGEYYIYVTDDEYNSHESLSISPQTPVLSVTNGTGEYILPTSSITLNMETMIYVYFKEKNNDITTYSFTLPQGAQLPQTVTGIIVYGTYTYTGTQGTMEVTIDTPTKTITI